METTQIDGRLDTCSVCSSLKVKLLLDLYNRNKIIVFLEVISPNKYRQITETIVFDVIVFFTSMFHKEMSIGKGTHILSTKG